MKQLMSVFWFLAILAVAYALILVILYLFQNSLMYHPVKNLVYSPAAVGLNYEDVTFETEDDVTIHGWYVSSPDARGTVLFSHGNAGNISGRIETIRILNRLNMDVLIYDYRGYGRSEGRPTEEGTYLDARAAWNFLVTHKGVPESEIIIMGRSLGGSVSAWLATQTNPVALVLESTFTSAGNLAQELYPWVPVRWLMKAAYPTTEFLQKISIPVLILHSSDDRLIPFHHGRELYQAAGEPKHFYEMNGGHGEGHVVTGSAYVETLDRFFDEVFTDVKKKTR